MADAKNAILTVTLHTCCLPGLFVFCLFACLCLTTLSCSVHCMLIHPHGYYTSINLLTYVLTYLLLTTEIANCTVPVLFNPLARTAVSWLPHFNNHRDNHIQLRAPLLTTGRPLSRQREIPRQVHHISLMVRGTPAHVKCYSYHDGFY